jgi:hypothetical protein
MKYMLLIYFEETSLTEDDREHCYGESLQLSRDLHEGGKFLGAAPLYPTSTATSIKLREGRRLVTDGPFAETREQLGGYYLVDAKDLDDAIAIASRIPAARYGTIEVRPVIEIDGVPKT